MTNLDGLVIWKRSHWMFFVFVQGMILSLLKFEKAIESGNLILAGIELEATANLMLGSGAAMVLAGNFSGQEYEKVRQTMLPPHVKSDKFSGVMSYDHAYLITIWKRLKPYFQTVHPSLQPQYDEFVSAYKFMASAHTCVCEKFGGGEAGSLRDPKNTALDTLSKFLRARSKLLNSNIQPTGEFSTSADECKELVKIGFKAYIQLLSRAFKLSSSKETFHPHQRNEDYEQLQKQIAHDGLCVACK